MTSGEEKKHRKELQRSILGRERAAEEAKMPIKKEKLKELFNFIEENAVGVCDHTLKHTKEFLKQQNLPTDTVVKWLADQVGFCDCEVIYNVEEKWGEE